MALGRQVAKSGESPICSVRATSTRANCSDTVAKASRQSVLHEPQVLVQNCSETVAKANRQDTVAKTQSPRHSRQDTVAKTQSPRHSRQDTVAKAQSPRHNDYTTRAITIE